MAQALHPCKVGSGIKEELTTPNPNPSPVMGKGGQPTKRSHGINTISFPLHGGRMPVGPDRGCWGWVCLIYINGKKYSE